MTIWANRKAQADLIEFRNLVVEYFNNTSARTFTGLELDENNRAHQARRKINLMGPRVSRWASAAGHGEIIYREPRMLGGRAYPLDLIANVFNLSRLQLSPQHLTDALEQALGVYRDDETSAKVRTLNPVYWVGRLFEAIASVPFLVVAQLGFDKDKAEASFIGRTIKTTLVLAQIAATIIGILEKLGLLEKAKHMVGL